MIDVDPPPARNPTATTASGQPPLTETPTKTVDVMKKTLMGPSPPIHPIPLNTEPEIYVQPKVPELPEDGAAATAGNSTSDEEPSLSESKKEDQKSSGNVGGGVAVPYTVPPWSEPPCHSYFLEVLKDGSIIDQFDVHEKGAYMFGRVDHCDFVLEHPTISHFHAVLQFNKSGGAFLYDLSSTHGTFINKTQVQKKVYVELHIGDVLRFGHSSPWYIFQGPPDLMPPAYSVPLSVYAESAFPMHVNCNETRLNEDTPSANGSKRAHRADNFDIEEDKLLASAWLNTRVDTMKRNDQKNSQFWKSVANYYAVNKTWDKDRSVKSLICRWMKISSIVSKFCAIHSQIEHLRRTSYTEHDKIAEAKQVFRKEEGHPFKLDHCWIILRFQHKWVKEQKKIEEKRKSKAHPSKALKLIDLEDENEEAPEPTSLKMPIGRNVAKEMSKKAKTKEQTSESDYETSKVRIDLEELRARRLERECTRAEQFQQLLASDQKHIELKKRWLELQVRNEEKLAALREKEIEKQVVLKEKELEVQAQIEEDKIMAMDTSGMSPTRVEYFKMRRKQIFAKQARRVENL